MSSQISFLLILLFSFQSVIATWFYDFKFFDEIFSLVCGIIYIRKIIRNGNIIRNDSRLIILIIALLGIGFVGNYKSGTTHNIIALLEDILANFKLFIVMLLFRNTYMSNYYKNKLRIALIVFCKILIITMFSLAVVTQFYNFGMGHDPRYNLLSFRFIFENAPALNAFFYFFSVLFSLVLYNNGNLIKNSTVFVFMMSATWILTLRSRGIAFGVIYLSLYFFIFFKLKGISKINSKVLTTIQVIFIAIMIGWNSFENYFIDNSGQVRFIMSRTAFAIAKDFAPFGSGFATFGTEASRKYYSVLYSQYKINNIWGISQKTGGSFILDQYWFGILGEFGFIGTILFAIMIYFMYKDIWSKAKINQGYQLAAITFIYTTFLGSISAATYINSYVIATIAYIYTFINEESIDTNNSYKFRLFYKITS